MKQRLQLLSILFLGVLILGGSRASAQLVGDCVFLKGKYVEIGVAPNGGYGSTLAAPSGFHPSAPTFGFWDPGSGTTVTTNQHLGFVADYGRDGWTTGTPGYFGDYYLPGTPQEGWAIQIAGAESDAYIPIYQTAGTSGYFPAGSMTGTSTGYSNSGGVSKAVWRGNKSGLVIRQTTTLDTNKLYFTVNVVLINTTATTLNNIYYIRTVDPDNDQTNSGSYNTWMTIDYQLPNPGNKVLVSTTGVTYTNAYLGLGTKDCRAKCMFFQVGGGLSPSYPLDQMWAESTPYTYTLGATRNDDVGIALDFNIGNLAPGDSTSLTYAYILNAAYIDSALNATQPVFQLNGAPVLSGTTINLCTYGSATADFSIDNGGFYHWDWNPTTGVPNPTSSTNSIPVAPIVDVTYTVTGVNASGNCDTVQYFIRLKKDTFSIHLANPDTVICYGDSVQARLTGPPLITYRWRPAAGVSDTTIMNPKFSPNVTTTYRCYAFADTTCDTVTQNFTITINRPKIDSITFTNPTVCGYLDGTFTLHGLETGYLDTLHYSFNGTPQPPLPVGVSSAHTIIKTGLGAGVYSNIWVKVGPCPTNTVGPITLTDPAPPTVSVDSHYVKTCVGLSTLMNAYVTPTGIAMNYTWTPPTDLSTSTAASTIVTPSVAGDVTYTITVNPGTNPSCNSSDTIHVHTLAPFVLNNNDTTICLTRSVQARVTGSNEYVYQWTPATGVSNPNIKNPLITPPLSQEYIVKASYANCPDQLDSFHIQVDTPAIARAVIDTICLGMSESFDFTVPGTAGTSAYTYTWTTAVMSDLSSSTVPNPTITPATVGTNFYALDIHPTALNCAVTSSVTLYVIDTNISIRPSPDTSICLGKVVQVVGNGDPLFSYQWLPTAGIAISNVLNALIAPDTSARYVVSANYGHCPTIYRSFQLNVEPNPVVYAGGNRLLCSFDTLRVTANVIPTWYTGYSYTWTPAADLDNTTTGTVIYSGATSTDLYVTVTTPSGCTSKDSVHVTVFPGNFATITPDHYSFCPHDATTPSVAISGGGAGSTYRWYPARYLDDSTSSAPVITPVSTQTYTVIVTTANGCKDTLNYYATVFPAALISIPDSVTLYPGESYQIDPLTNCNSFKWFPPAGLNADNVSNPIATPDISTRYIVHGTTSDGCIAVDSIDINVEASSLIVLPNAFTPGTGANNEFKIITKGMTTLNFFRVFNRWGNLLFETTNLSKGWDGTFNGAPQPLGVYVYQIEAVGANGMLFHKQGNVTLLR